MPFGKAPSAYDRGPLVFAVAGRWFCCFDADRFDRCNVKCDPERVDGLQVRYDGTAPAYRMNKCHRLALSLRGALSDAMIREPVRRSHGPVAASLPKKVRETLPAANDSNE